MHEIASMPEFDLNNYPESTVKLASSFKAVAGYMKSRSFRKVNRDVFVVSQNGFDMHKADELAEREQNEINILSDFLPEQLSEEELAVIVEQVIKETDADGPQDMGKVMGSLKQRIQGNADMGLVSKIVKDKLTA